MWEFDCPNHFIDLSSLIESNFLENIDNEWFSFTHKDHEAIDNFTKIRTSSKQLTNDNGKIIPGVKDNCKPKILRTKPKISPKVTTKKSVMSYFEKENHSNKLKENENGKVKVNSSKLPENKKKTVQGSRTQIMPSSIKPVKCSDKPIKEVQKDDLMELLKKHNEKFRGTTYEPSRHPAKYVRQWETASGKVWANLNSQEREQANKDIGNLK
jgi:hypothetical protein